MFPTPAPPSCIWTQANDAQTKLCMWFSRSWLQDSVRAKLLVAWLYLLCRLRSINTMNYDAIEGTGDSHRCPACTVGSSGCRGSIGCSVMFHTHFPDSTVGTVGHRGCCTEHWLAGRQVPQEPEEQLAR